MPIMLIGYLPVRTGPKAPSMMVLVLLIDMDHKGVSQPITLIWKIALRNLLMMLRYQRKINWRSQYGWTIAKKLLQHERKFISNFDFVQWQKDVVSIAKTL